LRLRTPGFLRIPLALLLMAAPAVRGAEPLTQHQRDVQKAGSLLRSALPVGALLLAWSVPPQPRSGSEADATGSWWLMGRSPRHDLLLALGRTWSITAALKYSVNETRPNGEPHSFPSGHASIAFASAEFIRKEYGWRWAAPSYAAASFVAWSRVEADKHYVHDVIAGALLGVLSNHDFWQYSGARGNARLSPGVLDSGRAPLPALRLEWAW
jgi:membrane-associated phospholipid phosphatase